MPRVDVPITQLTEQGVAPPAQVNADAANDHQLAYNDGRVFVEVVSSDAGAQSVTIITPGTVGGLAVADQVVAVPAGATRLFGPLPPAIYNQPDGTVSFDPSVTGATLKFRAYHL